jgi:hypothetical protein
MNIEKAKIRLKNAIENNEHLVFKNVFQNRPSWDQFINMIEHVDSTKYNSTNTRGDKFGIYESMYIRISDVFDPITKKNAGNTIPELDEVLSFCENLFEKESTYGEAYIN